MTIISDNISLIRANTVTTAFDSGEITENTSLAYSNLFYPYILDNGGNNQNISLTIDVMNRDELVKDTKNIVNKKWIDENRLANNLSNAKVNWGFKEAYHGVKKSRAISNAICFDGQVLTFYIAPQGHEAGYVDNSWLYCKTTLTVKVVNLANGSEETIYTFNNFESKDNDSTRYFSWTAPSIDQETYDNYGLFGICVLRLEVNRVYYEDAERIRPTDKIIPTLNQSHLQLLIYSGAKEIIEVDAEDANILKTLPSYSDTLTQIFSKTIFDDLQSLNYNALTDDQKRAIIADQIAVLFMSQHPVLFADVYPGKIIGFGANQALPAAKIINKIITYGKRYPDIVPLVKDRLFGMLATYKTFNFGIDIEQVISDYTQSTQYIRDPIRVILVDSNGILSSDFGIDGIAFNPYAMTTTNVEALTDIPPLVSVDLPLYDSLVDITNILITKIFGEEITPYTKIIRVGFTPVFGENDIKRIRYSLFTDNSKEYKTYIDEDGTSRYYLFNLDYFAVTRPLEKGDILTAQIDIEDKFGGVTSFIQTSTAQGTEEKPFLYDLKIYQRNDGSDVVDIYYTYKGIEEINKATLEAQFSIDGGQVWTKVPITSLKGDFGKNIMPGRRRITWLPSVDLKGLDVEYPILCRLTLYDEDLKLATGNTLTGALVWDLDKPEVAVMKGPFVDHIDLEKVTLNALGTYYVPTDGEVDFEYTGKIGTTATIVIEGESFVVGNINGYFVWDIGGEEHQFTFEGETIVIEAGHKAYEITYDGVGSLLFKVKFRDYLSSSSSSSSTEVYDSSSSSSYSTSDSTEIYDSSSSQSSSSNYYWSTIRIFLVPYTEIFE